MKNFLEIKEGSNSYEFCVPYSFFNQYVYVTSGSLIGKEINDIG